MQGTKSTTLRFGLVATLLVSVLAASAPPVSATDAAEVAAVTDGLVVGSQHDTASELSNAQTLTNLTVTGSGEAGAVTLDSGNSEFSDSFEDEPADSGAPDDWTVSNSPDTLEVVSTIASDGSQSVHITASSGTTGQIYPSYQPQTATTKNFSVSINQVTNKARIDLMEGGESGTITILVAMRDGDLQYYDGSSWVTISTTPDANEWVDVTIHDIDPSSDTFSVSWSASGGSGTSTGTSTGLSMRNAMSDGYDTSSLGATGGGGYFDGVSAVSGGTPTSATYISQVHSVTDAEQAAINITAASNVSVEATVRTDGGATLNQTTLSGTGNHTLSLAETSSEQLETVLDVTVTGSNPAFELGDESILFTNHKPEAANFEPPDGGQLTQRSVDFSVDVSDPEFPTAQGDAVEARLFVDGQQVGAETVTSNQTVSITHTIETGGDHDYYWELEDSYGSVTTTATKTVSAPGEISVYNSSAPTQLVDNAEVEIRVYANEASDAPDVYSRNTTDGTLNMSGLPADKPFVVVADAENYTTRRIFVPSLYETQRIYLLPDSEEAVSTEFQLEDYTGNYPGENSVLLVQRALNGSYQTVLGDFFGANDQFPAQLEYNVRHRLVIMNVETGERRVVGTYTPQSPSAQTIAITPSGITSFEEQPASVTVQPTTNRLPAVSDANLSVTLDNNSATIDSWNVTAVAANGSTSTTLWTYATQQPGTARQTVDLTGRSQETLLVNVTYVVDGATLTETTRISIDEVYDNDATLLATLTQLADLSAPGTRAEFTGFLSMLVTVFAVAATARIQPSSVISGFTGVMVVAGFSAIGWVGYDVVFVAAVGFVGFTAIERGL